MIMRITGYNEKIKKKDSDFTFQLEGTVDKDDLTDMIRSTAAPVLATLWNLDGARRWFDKITLPSCLQDSIEIHESESGEFVAKILDIAWDIKAEPAQIANLDLKIKGTADLDQDQLLAIQHCVRNHVPLVVRWFTRQMELPLDGNPSNACKKKGSVH